MKKRVIGTAIVCSVVIVFCLQQRIVLTANTETERNMQLTSPAFLHMQDLPIEHSCKSVGINPPLAWHSVPHGTKSLALIVSDPDAPTPPWIHWVVFNIPPTVTGLDAGMSADKISGIGIGKNTAGKTSYYPACPPIGHGKHRYHFVLYALDSVLPLQTGADYENVYRNIKEHTIAHATLIGTFAR